MIKIKNASQLKVGDKYLYTGHFTPYPNALYDAEVIGIYRHTVTLRVKIRIESTEETALGEVQPYNWSIPKINIGTTEILYKEGEEIEVSEID